MDIRFGAAVAVLGLAACQPTEPAGTDRAMSDRHGLSALPLTAESRTVLAQDLDQVQSQDIQAACSASEMEFVSISLKLYAIRLEEPLTEPWSTAEQSQVQAMTARWQSIGGDARDISDGCRAALSQIGLPIL